MRDVANEGGLLNTYEATTQDFYSTLNIIRLVVGEEIDQQAVNLSVFMYETEQKLLRERRIDEVYERLLHSAELVSNLRKLMRADLTGAGRNIITSAEQSKT